MSEININRLRNFHSRIVEEQHSFAGCFYAKLFESNPNIEKLFKSVGMKMQGKMVIQALGIGIKSYDKEESCRNAVMAASSMLASLPQINSNLRKYLGDEFRLGIGIAYGPMVTGELGFALKRQFTAVGDTVNDCGSPRIGNAQNPSRLTDFRFSKNKLTFRLVRVEEHVRI